jgi:putative FmdB family regulatory protein
MPMYEYTCKECGKEYEELVSLDSQEKPPCPACNSTKVEKKMSLFGSAGAAPCGTSGFS